MLKLTGLADAARAQAQAADAGLPPRMALADILSDPDNPRKPFEERSPEKQKKQRELNANIAARGVKNPISLRPHPTIPNKWIINAGHCRFEGATVAGHADIPYFIDRDFNSFDQVNENEQRSDLTPWELATFIQRKITEGMSKGDIAAGLHKSGQAFVTEHLALIDPPACLVGAYSAGVQSPRTLYELRKARDEFPEQVDSWCAGGAAITRDTIRALVTMLRDPRPAPDISQLASLEAAPPTDVAGMPESRPGEDTRVAADDNPEDEAAIAAETSQAIRAGQERVADCAAAGAAPTALVPPADKYYAFRHDETAPAARSRDTVGASPVKVRDGHRGIAVQYKGRAATLESDTVVKVTVDGHDAPLEVKVSDLVFKKR
ncbi:hypothetical protein ASF77_21700 [Massilia sp. Leaf139]|nr:hypothetical protein ASF77_21700 [Massilia sp. Leaf139]